MASALAWLERASLPVSQLADPRVIRAVLDGLCTRLDGSPAAASTITRKRAVFHGALGYAVELGLLPANPAGLVRWHAPRAAVAVSPATVPRDTRGGMLSESVYGRAWHIARQAALGPDLAATALARRPYDLRHAALSLWLNASGAKTPLTPAPASRIRRHGESERLYTPSAPPQTLSAICT